MPYADPIKQKEYWRQRHIKRMAAKPPKVLRSKYRWKNNGKNSGVPVHRLIAEKALGKPLPPRAEVHHVNSNGHENHGGNLVICPDHAYHSLLHFRTRALEACGHADWFKCKVCKQWDAPENLILKVPNGQNLAQGRHPGCKQSRKKTQ